MKNEYYVLGMHTSEGLFFVSSINADVEGLEIKATDDLRGAKIINYLDVCEIVVEELEHEAILNIYKIKLEEME